MRWRGVLIAIVVLAGVAPARAGAVEVSLSASGPGGRAGQNVRVVALVTDGGVPAAGREVFWETDGAGFIVVSDARTDAAGKARAIVRGWGEGEQVVEAWVGDPGFGCFGEDCDAVALDWIDPTDQCPRGGYGVEAAIGLVPLPPLRLGEIAGTGPCWENSFARNYVADWDGMGLLTTGAVGARYEPGEHRVRAHAAEVAVFPFEIGVAETRATSYCGSTPHTDLEIGLVTVTNTLTGETLFVGEPEPGYTINVTGVGRVVLNERSATATATSTSGSITGARVTLDTGPVTVRVAQATTGRTCEERGIDRIFGADGDAHTDYPTGPAHLSFDAVEDPFGGVPFVGAPLQYSDSRADPPGAPSQPFTCYGGTVATLVPEEPQIGDARARLTGTVTCKNLQSGTGTYTYELVVEDISPIWDPDFYEMTLRSGATTVYEWSDQTTGGWISVGGV